MVFVRRTVVLLLFDLFNKRPYQATARSLIISLFRNVTSEYLNELNANSCRFREPTIDGTDNGPAWPPFTAIDESSLLHIDSADLKIVKNPFREKYRFWKELPLHSRLEKLALLKGTNAKSEL